MENVKISDDIIKRMENDRFIKYCGVKLDEIKPGYARASLEVQDIHLNGVNIIQGGVLFTLADFTFAAAANSRGKVAVAIESSISFIKGISSGKIIAEAQELSCKKTLARYDVRISTDNGELIAVYHGTAFRKD
ncbi:MAG: PaaI family thioesterase [Spirochaetia bacterium]|nr:PaaI family thioesterase [Spirochaetia bacterium]